MNIPRKSSVDDEYPLKSVIEKRNRIKGAAISNPRMYKTALFITMEYASRSDDIA